MTALVLDTGALVALEGNDRMSWARLNRAAQRGADIQIPAGVIAQAWRGGGRQARLLQALDRCDEVALDSDAARASGRLCGAAGTSDVIDASVAVLTDALARRGPTTVLTSDPGDITSLLAALGSPARVATV